MYDRYSSVRSARFGSVHISNLIVPNLVSVLQSSVLNVTGKNHRR